MRKYPFYLSLLLVLAVMVGCNLSSGNKNFDVITASDIDEEADLTEIAFDFKIHPLKSDAPLDGIGGVKSWGDVMLARTNDDRKILRFDNYKLTGVLDRLGRGPGEYTYIEDFSYDAYDKVLYIENDSNLVTYDANTMEFIRKQPVNISIQNILNLDDKMLYFGVLMDDYHKETIGSKLFLPKESMILVDRDEYDITKGTVLYEEGYLARMLISYPELFYVNPKNRSTCLPGDVYRIVTFYNDSVSDVYRFRLGTADFPERLFEAMQKEEFEMDDIQSISKELSAIRRNSPYIGTVFNIMVDDKTVSFRMTYEGNGMLGSYSKYLYFVHHIDKGTKVYKHLRIPGLAMDVDPTGANGNHQIAIIENLGNAAIDESVPMSPLAQQIIDELKKQNDDNPVMLEFRFK